VTNEEIMDRLRLDSVRDRFTSPTIGFELVEFSPALASDALAVCNDGNRRVRKTRVPQYAADIANGRWQVNSNCIGFDVTGRMSNGQHRLLAVIQAGVAATFPVMTGLDASSFQTEDIGVQRNLGDVVPWMIGKGTQPASCLAGMVNGPNLGRKGWWALTRQEQIKAADAARDAIEFAVGAFSTHKAGFSRSGQLGAVACAYYHVPEDYLTEFTRRFQVDDQSSLPAKNPVGAMRRWAISTLENKGKKAQTVAGQALVAGDYSRMETCLAAFAKGGSLGHLRYLPKRRYFPDPLRYIEVLS
jgi:hypothetical protein